MNEITHGYGRLCLVTAVDFEFKSVSGLLVEPAIFEDAGVAGCRGQWKERPVVVLRTEMGAVGFGARLQQYLAAEPQDAVIVIGLAGGLSSGLQVGDAIIYEHCLDARARQTPSGCEEIASIATDAGLSDLLARTLNRGTLRYRIGTGVTIRRIATTKAEKTALAAAHHGVLAVDLESCEVLQACALVGVPATVLRIISDAAKDDIPDFNRAYDAAGHLRPAALLSVMAARPAAAIRLIANIRRVKVALQLSAAAALDASIDGG